MKDKIKINYLGHQPENIVSDEIPPNMGPSYRPIIPLPLEGPSLRDQFAMAALMCYRGNIFDAPHLIAEKAYIVADAMMEEREKKHDI